MTEQNEFNIETEHFPVVSESNTSHSKPSNEGVINEPQINNNLYSQAVQQHHVASHALNQYTQNSGLTLSQPAMRSSWTPPQTWSPKPNQEHEQMMRQQAAMQSEVYHKLKYAPLRPERRHSVSARPIYSPHQASNAISSAPPIAQFQPDTSTDQDAMEVDTTQPNRTRKRDSSDSSQTDPKRINITSTPPRQQSLEKETKYGHILIHAPAIHDILSALPTGGDKYADFKQASPDLIPHFQDVKLKGMDELQGSFEFQSVIADMKGIKLFPMASDNCRRIIELFSLLFDEEGFFKIPPTVWDDVSWAIGDKVLPFMQECSLKITRQPGGELSDSFISIMSALTSLCHFMTTHAATAIEHPEPDISLDDSVSPQDNQHDTSSQSSSDSEVEAKNFADSQGLIEIETIVKEITVDNADLPEEVLGDPDFQDGSNMYNFAMAKDNLITNQHIDVMRKRMLGTKRTVIVRATSQFGLTQGQLERDTYVSLWEHKNDQGQTVFAKGDFEVSPSELANLVVVTFRNTQLLKLALQIKAVPHIKIYNYHTEATSVVTNKVTKGD